jgi:hypothetical protein
VPARLACVKHAASVRPEPGSNSPSKPCTATPLAGEAAYDLVESWSKVFPRRGAASPTCWLKTFVVVRSQLMLCSDPFMTTASRGQGAGSPALTFEPSVPFSRCNHLRDAGSPPEVPQNWPGVRLGPELLGPAASPDCTAWQASPYRPEGRLINLSVRPLGVKPPSRSREPAP